MFVQEKCITVGFRPECGDVLRDRDRLQEVTIRQGGCPMTPPTPTTGLIGPLFEAAWVALPPNICDSSAT